jgi:hypothetical protein
LRCVRRIRHTEFNQSEIDELIRKKKKHKNSAIISDNIDELLYIPDIITVEFDDSRHYKTIINNGGISLNGHIYKRLLAGAGMSRRSTAMFCNSEIIDDVLKFLNNGRDENYKIVPSKYNAYVALASSSTWRVPEPNFVVVPDCEVERWTEVDFLHESSDKNKDPLVYPEKKLLKFNLWDGQGLISPNMAGKWSKSLGLDYLPSAFVFRGAFLKGLLVVFDFAEFADLHNVKTIKDIYGNIHQVKDIECIISASQFKLAGAYKNTEEYRRICKENDYAWGVSRYSPKIDKNHCFATYQYLQNLKIETDEQIENLCKKTVDWFNDILGTDWESGWPSLLFFLMGDVDKNRVGKDWFDNLDNPLLQALILEPKLINDKQIQKRVQRLIAKKIKESYLGVLLLNGNYSFMVSDPAGQAEWALGLEVKGLLGRNEYYSNYWNLKDKDTVSAIRSPMTFRSENNVLYLKNNKELNYWYKYIYSGIVFNVFGNDMMQMSGAD